MPLKAPLRCPKCNRLLTNNDLRLGLGGKLELECTGCSTVLLEVDAHDVFEQLPYSVKRELVELCL